MKVVEIKQLKARLSEYVRLAKAGETVLVTERGEVVAELRPARRQPSVREAFEDILEALAASGVVTRAAQPKSDWSWHSHGLGLPPETGGSARRLEAGSALIDTRATGSALYLDTSVALRATLERGTTPEVEARIAAAPVFVLTRVSKNPPVRRSRGVEPGVQ